MNYQIVRNIIGKLMILLAILMVLPLFICIIYQEELINYIAFLVPIGLLLIIGILFNVKKAQNKKMLAREGFIIVGVSWLVMSLFGCIPYIISGVLTNPIDAFFEITSGFTTTGATIMGGLNSRRSIRNEPQHYVLAKLCTLDWWNGSLSIYSNDYS